MKYFLRGLFVSTLSMGVMATSKREQRQQQRALVIDRIAGYMPTTDVTDQLMLDLDQYNIEEQVIQLKINVAKHVYEHGGHSVSYAVLKLIAPSNTTYAVENGASVWAYNKAGLSIKGTLQDDLFWDISPSNQTFNISVLYDKDQGYEHCQSGALYLFKAAALNNCKLGCPMLFFLTCFECPHSLIQ
jgi:hypothetical protein